MPPCFVLYEDKERKGRIRRYRRAKLLPIEWTRHKYFFGCPVLVIPGREQLSYMFFCMRKLVIPFIGHLLFIVIMVFL